MSAVINQKTKSTLSKIIRDGLAVALRRSVTPEAAVLDAKTVAAVSVLLVDQLVDDNRFLDCIDSIATPKTSEFLTTEDAARLSGFSRPFIIALLDGPLYPGTVIRTPKGHRRVIRDEFMAWRENVSQPKGWPESLKDVRSGPRDEEPVVVEGSEEPTRESIDARVKAMKNARSLGLF